LAISSAQPLFSVSKGGNFWSKISIARIAAKSSQGIFLMAILKDLRLTVQSAVAKETAKTVKGKLVSGRFSATSAMTAATGFRRREGFDPAPCCRFHSQKPLFFCNLRIIGNVKM
jgi:hypothetical protein